MPYTILKINQLDEQSYLSQTLTNRQQAEIQLNSLLNEPEKSLPAFVLCESNKFSSKKISIEELSKQWKAHPLIIERLVRVFYPSKITANDTITFSKLEVERLIRILNATIEVRAFIFFLILSEDENAYVTEAGLTAFYRAYFKALKTLDENRIQDSIKMLIQKFQLDHVSV